MKAVSTRIPPDVSHVTSIFCVYFFADVHGSFLDHCESVISNSKGSYAISVRKVPDFFNYVLGASVPVAFAEYRFVAENAIIGTTSARQYQPSLPCPSSDS
jgi:hypothetical protein